MTPSRYSAQPSVYSTLRIYWEKIDISMYNNCQQSAVRVDWELEKVASTRDVFNGVPEGKIIQGATVDNFPL
jgi:hypothetical protein